MHIPTAFHHQQSHFHNFFSFPSSHTLNIHGFRCALPILIRSTWWRFYITYVGHCRWYSVDQKGSISPLYRVGSGFIYKTSHSPISKGNERREWRSRKWAHGLSNGRIDQVNGFRPGDQRRRDWQCQEFISLCVVWRSLCVKYNWCKGNTKQADNCLTYYGQNHFMANAAFTEVAWLFICVWRDFDRCRFTYVCVCTHTYTHS